MLFFGAKIAGFLRCKLPSEAGQGIYTALPIAAFLRASGMKNAPAFQESRGAAARMDCFLLLRLLSSEFFRKPIEKLIKMCYTTFVYLWGRGYCTLSPQKITEGGLDNDEGQLRQSYRLGSARLGSARLGSARLGRSIAPFFPYVKSYLIKIPKTSLPETGFIAPSLRLFCMH